MCTFSQCSTCGGNNRGPCSCSIKSNALYSIEQIAAFAAREGFNIAVLEVGTAKAFLPDTITTEFGTIRLVE